MSPLEINTKIAEIKGLKIMLSPKDQNGLYVEAKIGGTIPYLKTTNWAENISDAWELFEEMGGQIITEDRYNGSYSKGKWLCTYGTTCPEEVLLNGPQADDTTAMVFWQNPRFIVAADTAPMAICLAWIAWKENK